MSNIDVDTTDVRRRSAAMSEKGQAALAAAQAATARIGKPVGATSPHGARIAAAINAIEPGMAPEVAAARRKQLETELATEKGAAVVDRSDAEGGSLFTGDKGAEGRGQSPGQGGQQEAQQMQQMMQMASQAGSSLLQVPAQLLQTATQSVQQVAQTAGQMAQQGMQMGSQIMSQSNERELDALKGSDGGVPVGAGGELGASAGSGGGALDGGGAGVGGGAGAGSGGVLPGAVSAAGAQARAQGASTATSTAGNRAGAVPMGGMPIMPMNRGAGQGQGGTGITPGAEAEATAPLVDDSVLPSVEQQIGALPVIESPDGEERPPFEAGFLGGN